VTDLEGALRILAQQRRRAATYKEALDSARTEWEAAHADLIQSYKDAQDAVAQAEECVRTATLAEFERTGSKAPAPCVGVRVMTRLVYDANTALAWAREHDMALSLDKRAFEKVAKASPPEFVEIVQEPSATIAVDLSAYLTPDPTGRVASDSDQVQALPGEGRIG